MNKEALATIIRNSIAHENAMNESVARSDWAKGQHVAALNTIFGIAKEISESSGWGQAFMEESGASDL